MSSYKLKILLCGPKGSGKTSLINRFIHTRFQTDYKLTVGVDILTKDVELENKQICTLSIWNVGDQDRFEFIRSTFYKGAAGALLVFDLSRAQSWDDIKNWHAEIKQYAGDIPFVLIGNNLDLLQDVGECVNRNEYRDYAESQNSFYIETSAKNNLAFDNVMRDALKKLSEEIV